MSEVFLKLLNLSITASWLILAVILIRPLLRKAPKWINCALWALVAIRLVCPFSFESSLSLVPSAETVNTTHYLAKPYVQSGVDVIDHAANSYLGDHYFEGVTVATRESLSNPITFISLIWLIGVAALLLYALISYIKLKKSVGASIAIKDNIMACDDVKSPFILGIIKPVIYVPSSMTGETLTCVMNHEMAHIKRHDHWWKPLGYLLLTVYWFNPLCWLAYILLCRDIEMACDEKVIRNMNRDEKATYSQALLNCNFPRKKIAACPLAFGEIGVKERVKSVLNYKKPAFWIIVVAVIACVAVAVCFMTNPKDNEPDLSFLNYENACSLVADVTDVDTIYYPPTNKNEDGIISIGYVNGNELAKYLDTVSWQKWKAPQEGLSSPGSIEFCISDDYRITVYQKPRWAVVTYGDEVRYYKTHGGDYADAVKLFYTGADNQSNVMQATVIEIENGAMLVKPVEGAWELNSSDLFRIPIQNMEASPEPRIGDTIEVEYDGGILETYPASLENIIYISVVEQSVGRSYTYNVAFANWTDDNQIYAAALNHETMAISSVQHLPIYKCDFVAELDSFKVIFSDILTMDSGLDEAPSFDYITAAYNDSFFNEKSLILVYIPTSSGSYRFGVSDVNCDGKSLCVYIEQLNNPEVHDAMMSGWFAVVEVDKEEIAFCKSFDAQLGKTLSEEQTAQNETYYNLTEQGKLQVTGSIDSNHSYVQSQRIWTNSTKISVKNNSGTDVTVYLYSVENERAPILEMTLSNKEKKVFTNLSSQYVYFVRISSDSSANVSVDISD